MNAPKPSDVFYGFLSGIGIVYLILTILVAALTISVAAQTNYFNKPSRHIHAQHKWVFNENELKHILVNHLKHIGTNVPDGIIIVEGLENHYDWINNQRIELIVKEK